MLIRNKVHKGLPYGNIVLQSVLTFNDMGCFRNKSSQKKRSNFYSNIIESCREFNKNTTLHGLKYVEDKTLSYWERIFFMLAFLAAFILLVNFVLNLYTKWIKSPVIIGINPVPLNIKRMPFPAVTICNMNQASASKVANMTRNSIDSFVLQALCEQDLGFNETEDFENLLNWETFEKVTLKVSQPCSKLIVQCNFGTTKTNCSELFKSVIVDDGLCCSFNSAHESIFYKNASNAFHSKTILNNLTLTNWTLEHGYPMKGGPFYPYPALGVGRTYGLNLILDAEIKDYYCSSSSGPGFKILLHNPNEVPNMNGYGLSFSAGSEYRFIIQPDISNASPLLKKISQHDRQCLFNNEMKLQYYGKYLTRNCEYEFWASQIMKKCNCTQYFMPRIDPDMRLCSIQDKPCYESFNFCNDNANCSSQCSPGCFELKFSTSSTTAPIRQQKFAIRNKLLQGIPVEYATENMAVIHIYYMENSFRPNTKEQYVGMTDFVANAGGLLGLFLGFSSISLVEIFYYVVFKPFLVRRKTMKEIQRIQKFWVPKDITTFEPIKLQSVFKDFKSTQITNRRKMWFKKSVNIKPLDLEIPYCN